MSVRKISILEIRLPFSEAGRRRAAMAAVFRERAAASPMPRSERGEITVRLYRFFDSTPVSTPRTPKRPLSFLGGMSPIYTRRWFSLYYPRVGAFALGGHQTQKGAH